ncbi:MAG: Fic family protein [Sandaracinaceae bacterium]
MLINDGELTEPHLYVSLDFKQHRSEYYARLQATRDHGDWMGWLRFFLQAVSTTTRLAVEAAQVALALHENHRREVRSLSNAGSVLRVLAFLSHRPMVTSRMLVEQIQISAPTANNALSALERRGIVEEITGKKRGRVYAYRSYIGALAGVAGQ